MIFTSFFDFIRGILQLGDKQSINNVSRPLIFRIFSDICFAVLTFSVSCGIIIDRK